MRDLVILPHAVREAAAAVQWYDAERPGLGEAFYVRLEECIDFIHRNPQWHAEVEASYRRALVRRFPFAVFYRYDDQQVIIYSVFHCAQDPQKWPTQFSE